MIIGRAAPPGHVALLHSIPERVDHVVRAVRAASHRVTVVDAFRPVQSIISAAPDLLIASLAVRDPPLGVVVRSVRQALGSELPVLVLVDRDSERRALVVDDPDSLVDADDLIREPVDAGELDLRVGGMLRARLEGRVLQRRVQELLGLYKISWAFSLAGGAEGLYHRLTKQSAEMLGADKALVLLFDRERRLLLGQSPGYGLTTEQVAQIRYAVDGEPKARWNFRKNGPLISNNATADTRLIPETVQLLGLHSVIVVPMTAGPRLQGLLVVADRASRAPFSDDDLNFLLAVAGQATVAVDNLRLHDEIKRKNALLEEYDRLKSEFVAIVAHDFRKPLMAIRGFAELVQDDADLPAETRRAFMQTIIDETDQLAVLANDTLLITQIETGQLKYHWREIDVGPLILQTIPLGLSEHSVLLDIPSRFPNINADAGRLRQVLTNLIGNAVKYSPQGGSVTVRCRERGPQHVVIEVIDRGMGIPADQLSRLFQKFERVRTEQHLAIPGTGLGLYICRLIVEGHGGQMWVESEIGKGSTFGLVLPLDAPAAHEAHAAQLKPLRLPRVPNPVRQAD